jgi:hypothetical protein
MRIERNFSQAFYKGPFNSETGQSFEINRRNTGLSKSLENASQAKSIDKFYNGACLIQQNMKMVLDRKILFVKVIGELLFVFGLLEWGNGVLIQFTYPMVLSMPASYLLQWIILDTFTILSFLVSAIGFFIWRLSAELIKFEKDKASDKPFPPPNT